MLTILKREITGFMPRTARISGKMKSGGGSWTKKTGLTLKEALLVHNYSEVKYEIPAAKAEAAAPQGSVTM